MEIRTGEQLHLSWRLSGWQRRRSVVLDCAEILGEASSTNSPLNDSDLTICPNDSHRAEQGIRASQKFLAGDDGNDAREREIEEEEEENASMKLRLHLYATEADSGRGWLQPHARSWEGYCQKKRNVEGLPLNQFKDELIWFTAEPGATVAMF